MKKSLPWLLPILTGLGALILWTSLAIFANNPESLPSPISVVKALVQNVGAILPAVGRDVFAMVVGYVLAVALGLATAIALTTYQGLRLALTPWIAIGRMTPLLLLAPIFILSSIPHSLTLILVTTVICYVPIVAILTPALAGTKKVLVDLFATYRASYWQEVWLLRLPHALPHLMRALRRAAILAPLATLLTDLLEGTLASQPGLGLILREFYDAGNMPGIYALCITAAFTGLVLSCAVDACAAWVLAHWHDHENGN